MLKTLRALTLAFISFLPVSVAKSQGIVVPSSTDTGLSDASVFEVIENVILFLTSILGVLAILAILVSGVMYITSGGDQGRTDTAKKILLYSVIGLVVALVAYVIVVVVSGIF